MSIVDYLSIVQKNVLLASHTTFRIGGRARYFFVAKSKEDIVKAIAAAKKFNLPIFILGGGSNLLVSDKGFDGLVIKVNDLRFTIYDLRIECGAGVLLNKIVSESVNSGLTGLEWAMGIPGTIGGAVYGNAGAYGHSISEVVEEVTTLTLHNCNSKTKRPSENLISCKEKKYSNRDCQFAYRDSVFKRKDEVILEVMLKLEKGDKEKSKKQIAQIISQRKDKIPPYPSAGSVFKNYEIKSKNYEEDALIKKFPALLAKVKGGKIPTGYLIEQCSLKGKQIGQAKIADEHANFIVNLGGASAQDVVALIELCKKKIKEKFEIELEEEIRYMGFDNFQ